MTVLTEPRTASPVVDLAPAALIEEARQRQQRRRALVAFLALVLGAIGVLPLLAGGDGSGTRSSGDDPFGALMTSPDRLGHTATSVLFVAPMQIDVDPRPGNTNDDYLSGIERLTTTFRVMIESRNVVSEAIQRSDVRRSVGDVVRGTAATRGSTPNLIEVSVTDRDTQTAHRLSNAISDVFVEQINELGPSSTDDNLVGIYERARETP